MGPRFVKRCFLISAVDTLFFRDGRPFNQDDDGLSEAGSLFPPPPWPLAGALRAGFARKVGWTGETSWQGCNVDQEGRAVLDALGDGPTDTGNLRFWPLQLALFDTKRGALRDVDSDQSDFRALWPCPFNLRRRDFEPWEETKRPNAPSPWVRDALAARPHIDTRLQDNRGPGFSLLDLDTSEPQSYRPSTGYWIHPEGLKAYLGGETPLPSAEQYLHDIAGRVATEIRIGQQRGHDDRLAIQGMLYSAGHKRLPDDLALLLTVEIDEATSPLAHRDPADMLPLGGQGRMASWAAVDPPDAIKTLEPNFFHADTDWHYYSILLLSPTSLDKGSDGKGLGVDDFPGEWIAACHDRPTTFAGWHYGRPEGRRHRRYFQPGSVFFLRAPRSMDASTLLGQLHAHRCRGLGASDTRDVGCGQFAIGTFEPIDRENVL